MAEWCGTRKSDSESGPGEGEVKAGRVRSQLQHLGEKITVGMEKVGCSRVESIRLISRLDMR